MAYGQWKIDEELTFKEFGYYSNMLSRGSKKPVKCICEACGIVTNKRLREASRKHICKSIIDDKKNVINVKKIKTFQSFRKIEVLLMVMQNVVKNVIPTMIQLS